MLIDVLYLVLGLVALVFGATWLVDGASSLAKKAGISTLTIGLTVVAFGTSMPELVVNLLASASGSTELAIGNVVGSNTLNIFLIVGIAAIIKPVNVQRKSVLVEIPFSLLAAVVLFFMANDLLIDGASQSVISRSDGLVLFSFFAIFLYYNFLTAKSGGAPEEDITIKQIKPWLAVVMVFVGIFLLFIGGKFIVDGGSSLARTLGVSESLIGLTVVAIGTSLPELATSAMAAYRGNSDIAIGNVVGSNIFNIFFILGTSSLVRPLPFYSNSNVDILVTCLASILLFSFVLIGSGRRIDRREGVLFVSLYLIYTAYLIVYVG